MRLTRPARPPDFLAPLRYRKVPSPIATDFLIVGALARHHITCVPPPRRRPTALKFSAAGLRQEGVVSDRVRAPRCCPARAVVPAKPPTVSEH